MALRFLVHKGSLTADMADKVMFMFRANDDNVRAAFKVRFSYSAPRSAM